MIEWPNVTVSSQQGAGLTPEELQRSQCILGFIPVVYYSVLLCVGVPGKLQPVCSLPFARLARLSRSDRGHDFTQSSTVSI